MTLAVNASYVHIGPWLSSAAKTAVAAYRGAEARRPIAEAVAECFTHELHRPCDEDAQQSWHSDGHGDAVRRRRFESFAAVYGAGQFTWAGVWTVTAPPGEVHGELVSVCETGWQRSSADRSNRRRSL